ncbi:MAG TPA: FeoA family protein [Gemmatimonadales bacterium]|nr:FeoA family protein [Gemmatimonadales bacterium]
MTAGPPDSLPLTALAEGRRGRVVALEAPASPEALKLAALGVLPGADLVLLQRFPAFVFRIGHAEFAVDEALARLVYVVPVTAPTARPAPPPGPAPRR